MWRGTPYMDTSPISKVKVKGQRQTGWVSETNFWRASFGYSVCWTRGVGSNLFILNPFIDGWLAEKKTPGDVYDSVFGSVSAGEVYNVGWIMTGYRKACKTRPITESEAPWISLFEQDEGKDPVICQASAFVKRLELIEHSAMQYKRT